MNILKSIEQKLEGLVEGVFGRAFKASVQPVELAHKLAKEMGDHKIVGVSAVYVPNEFEVYLGGDDYENLSAFETSLKTELGNYVSAFARREGWTMVAPPRIELRRDDDLRVGEFGIATQVVDPRRAEAAGSGAAGSAAGVPLTAADAPLPAADVPGAAPPFAPPGAAVGPAQTVLYDRPPAPAPALLRGPSGAHELLPGVTLIGRSRRCDIVLPDPNVSRQHAEVRCDGGEYVLRDLGSTNGTRVNRRDVRQAVLRHGDRIEVGTTELRFERRS
jgi:hypothetical protein